MEKLRSKLLWRNHREYQWLLFENFQIALLVFSADLNKVPARGKQKHLSCQALHTWPRNPLIYFFRTGICKYLLASCLKTQSCNVTQVNLELNYVAKDNPELPIFLLPFFQYWDYRSKTPFGMSPLHSANKKGIRTNTKVFLTPKFATKCSRCFKLPLTGERQKES